MEELPLPEKGCQVPFYRAQALPHFCVTAWVFLPDPSADGHCICAPVYPVAISLAMKSVKQSSMSAVNQYRSTDGELWQTRPPS